MTSAHRRSAVFSQPSPNDQPAGTSVDAYVDLPIDDLSVAGNSQPSAIVQESESADISASPVTECCQSSKERSSTIAFNFSSTHGNTNSIVSDLESTKNVDLNPIILDKQDPALYLNKRIDAATINTLVYGTAFQPTEPISITDRFSRRGFTGVCQIIPLNIASGCRTAFHERRCSVLLALPSVVPLHLLYGPAQVVVTGLT
jgi:hypothetical protein